MIKPAPKDLSGILVALITPFTDDGLSIDKSRLKSHIEYMISTGIHGLVPGGSTGEFTALTLSERKTLVELCVEYAAGRVPVVAGIGTLSTTDSIELASHAASVGADALMVVPPFYDPVPLPQLRDMFAAIHDAASGLPIMYYNIPGASGLKLSPSEMADLSDVGVRYLKDTSGDAPALTDLIFSPELNTRITAFNGWDTLTFYGLAAGAKGSVWGASNIIPELSVALWDTVALKGDLVKGREIWSKIFPICRFLEANSYSGAVKTGMELRGWKTGGLRKPFALIEGDKRDELKRLLVEAGVEVV